MLQQELLLGVHRLRAVEGVLQVARVALVLVRKQAVVVEVLVRRLVPLLHLFPRAVLDIGAVKGAGGDLWRRAVLLDVRPQAAWRRGGDVGLGQGLGGEVDDGHAAHAQEVLRAQLQGLLAVVWTALLLGLAVGWGSVGLDIFKVAELIVGRCAEVV